MRVHMSGLRCSVTAEPGALSSDQNPCPMLSCHSSLSPGLSHWQRTLRLCSWPSIPAVSKSTCGGLRGRSSSDHWQSSYRKTRMWVWLKVKREPHLTWVIGNVWANNYHLLKPPAKLYTYIYIIPFNHHSKSKVTIVIFTVERIGSVKLMNFHKLTKLVCGICTQAPRFAFLPTIIMTLWIVVMFISTLFCFLWSVLFLAIAKLCTLE